MFKRLAARSVPDTPRTSASDKSSIISVATLQSHSNSTSTTQDNHQVNVRGLETVLSLLDGFASSLLLQPARRTQLKSKCMGTLIKDDDPQHHKKPGGASILQSAHTLLTYMSWAIQHFEKAASPCSTAIDAEHNAEVLDKADRMLMTLTESMDIRGFTAAIPNAHLLGLAHIYLALIWKLKEVASKDRTMIKEVAGHLLEIFLLCPKYARLCYAPELWDQIFKPSLSGVETWYRNEYKTIANYSQSLSAVIPSSPCSPNIEHRGNLRSSSTRLNEYQFRASPSKRAEKIKLQINLLYELYEETLDEGTQAYAQQYKEMVTDLDIDTLKSMKLNLASNESAPQIHHQRKKISVNQGNGMPERKPNSKTDVLRTDKFNSRHLHSLQPASPLQFRQSLLETVFGTLLTPKKPGRAARPPNILHLCNKELPQILQYQDSTPSRKVQMSRDASIRTAPIIEEEASSYKAEVIHPDICEETHILAAPGQNSSHRLIDLIKESEIKEIHSPPVNAVLTKRQPYSISVNNSLVSLTNMMEGGQNKDVVFEQKFQPTNGQYDRNTLSSNPTKFSKVRRSSFSLAEDTMRQKALTSQRHRSRSKVMDEPSVTTGIQNAASNRHTVSLQLAAMYESQRDILELQKNHSMPKTSTNMITSTSMSAGDVTANGNTTDSALDNAEDDEGSINGEQVQRMLQVECDMSTSDKTLHSLLQELHAAVADAQQHRTGVHRCEEVLLCLSQAWLETKVSNTTDIIHSAEFIPFYPELINDLLYILATSDLPEAQHLALCLLSTSTTACNKLCRTFSPPALLVDPSILCLALSHLLNKSNRVPEAALLLHLLHPSTASSHLQKLLPLLLNIAHSNKTELGMPPKSASILALKLAAELLSAADHQSRFHACKQILFPDALMPLVQIILEESSQLEEACSAASILIICIQTHTDSRNYILTQVKPISVVSLLRRTACKTSFFKTVIDFVIEILSFSRLIYWTQVIRQIQQEGFLNCIHALMAYLQTASLEHRAAAACLLLQLDLLSTQDHRRYGVFREEALDAIAAALSSERNKEANLSAGRSLLRMARQGVAGSSGGSWSSTHAQRLEAWLLKKAGLEEDHCGEHEPYGYLNYPQERLEDFDGNVDSDTKLAEALLGYGRPLIRALARGVQSDMEEVRKACLLVTAWLSCHLDCDAQSKLAVMMKKRSQGAMREIMVHELQRVVQGGSAIELRIYAALALQNIGTTS